MAGNSGSPGDQEADSLDGGNGTDTNLESDNLDTVTNIP